MKVIDLLSEEIKKKPVTGFSVVLNQIGKNYDYNNTGFVVKGAKVLKGKKLPLTNHIVLNPKSEDIGELYARR
jgi:hypothetical protein